jgi:hydrogenase maturation protease
MYGRVLVAGIGNIFLGDDAFGGEVVRRLQRRPLPKDVRVEDFGIRSYDLVYALMEDWDLAILVDALPRGDQPGTVYTLEPEVLAGAGTATMADAHSMNPVSVLQMLDAMGARKGRLLVVGCEPATVEPDPEGNIGLSAPVKAAVEGAVSVIEDLIIRARSDASAA